jgi:NAD(P)H-hydrate repair Nnr-like enzyme with NAD(P)H-hydrate epimerase domain
VKTDACSNLINASAKLIITNSEIPSGVEVYTGSTSTSGACPVKDTDITAANAKVVSVTATGGTQSSFDWTWIAEKGKF